MARPRRYATNAERQAAWRARQNGAETEPADPEPPTPPPPEPQAEEQPEDPAERYVREQVEITRQLIEAGALTNDRLKYRGETLDRLQRTERYARWRWQAVQDGSVAAL